MRIRAVSRRDHVLLAEMRYAFRTELEEGNQPRDAFVARMTAWLDQHLPDASDGARDAGHGAFRAWRGWLAVDDPGEELIGHVFLHLMEKVPNPVPEPELIGYVTNLYVVPEQRGRGLGALLLEQATRECRDLGCDSVVLWPSPRSVSLYERHGFRRPGRVMELGIYSHPEEPEPGLAGIY